MGWCMCGVGMVAWMVHEWVMWCSVVGVEKLHGLVRRLDLGVGRGLDGDGEEVVGVVSCEMEISMHGPACLSTPTPF